MSDYLNEIIQKFGNDYIKTNNDEIRYKCPFCLKRRGKADEDAKLYANTKSGKFHCFKCGASGYLNVLPKTSNSNVYGRIINFLYNKSSDNDDEENIFYVPNNKIEKGTLAYEYCLSRNITEEKIDYYDIRLGVNELYGRIVIPNEVYGDTGIWTDMYSSRTFIDQIPKYKNPVGVKKNDIVFNLHRIKENCEKIIIVEGCITAICAGKNAVAIYGCNPTYSQINSILSKKPKSIYCVLDGDTAGSKGNAFLLNELSNRYNGTLYSVKMPFNVDASDMGENKFQNFIEINKTLYVNGVYKNLIDFIRS